MAIRGAILGIIGLLILFMLAAGCMSWTGGGNPTATGTPQPTTGEGPVSTGAGGAEETPSPIATTVRITPTATTVATTAAPTETPTTTATTTAVPTESATPTAETTVATTGAGDAVPTGTSTIAELASADPELSRFADALREGGVYEMLNGTGTYTVFAPNNAAFDAVPLGTLSRLYLDRNALDTVANYHVVYGRWFSADLVRESSVTTRSGAQLDISTLPDGTLQVDGARVTRADIIASNGVLHVIDRVMIPPGVV